MIQEYHKLAIHDYLTKIQMSPPIILSKKYHNPTWERKINLIKDSKRLSRDQVCHSQTQTLEGNTTQRNKNVNQLTSVEIPVQWTNL